MQTATGGSTWIIDLIALAFIGWYAVRGWRVGLVRSLILVGGLVLAIYVGARFAPSLADSLGTTLPSGTRYGIAFVFLLAVVMLGVAVLARLVGKAMAASPLNFLDRAGGAAFGALKALLYLAVIAVVLAMVSFPSRWVSNYLDSRIVRTSVNLGGAVVRIAKPYVSEPLGDFIDKAQEYIRKRTEEATERIIQENSHI